MIALPPELAAAVNADPHDDDPRRACADWLDEHGDAEWAELIRVQLTLARPGPARGVAESQELAGREADLVRALRERLRRAIERPPLGAGGSFFAKWRRGFVHFFSWGYRVTPDLWRALPALAAVEELDATGAGGLPVAELATVSELKGLTSLKLTLEHPGPLAFADVEPLADLPLLRELHLCAASRLAVSIVPREVADQLAAERHRRAAGGAAAALAELRGLCARVDVSEAGDVWAFIDRSHAPHAGRRADLFAAVPSLRGVSAQGAPLPALGRSPGLRSLHGTLRLFPDQLPDGPTDLRELAASVESGDRFAVPAWAARQPRLAALSLSLEGYPPGVADLAPLSGAPALRVLHTPRLNWPAHGVVVPNLVELSCDDPTLLAPADLRAAFPSLRYLTVRDRLTEAAAAGLAEVGVVASVPPADGPPKRDRPPLPEPWSDWPRQEADGVSLAVPPWFRRYETPAPHPRYPDVVPLALWREWGEPDGSDDDLFFGPVVLWLECLRRRLFSFDGKDALLQSPSAFPVVGRGRAWRASAQGNRHAAVCTIDAAGRATRRYLWIRGDSAVRLVARFGPLRSPSLERLVLRVAESYQSRL